MVKGFASCLCMSEMQSIHLPGLHFACVELHQHLPPGPFDQVQQMSLNIEWTTGKRQMKRVYFEHFKSVISSVRFAV